MSSGVKSWDASSIGDVSTTDGERDAVELARPAAAGPEPLLVSAFGAAELRGKNIRTWRTWDSAGAIPRPMRIGRSRLWRVAELRAWVAAGCPPRDAWEQRTHQPDIALSPVATRGNS